MPYAGMAELADALDLGSSGQPCGFDSHYPYHVGAKFALLRRLFCLRQKRRHPPAPLFLLLNCDPLRWARSWWAALQAAFSPLRNIDFNRPSQKEKIGPQSHPCANPGL